MSPETSMTFDRYMARCLYDPHMGYYMTQVPMGPEGDFTTAPELNPFLAQAIARTCAAWATSCDPFTVVEIGPGRGRMAGALLQAAPFIQRYVLVEISPTLRQAQKEHLSTLPEALRAKCVFTDQAPQEPFSGLILGNEVLDALPVKQFIWRPNEILHETVVIWEGSDPPVLCERPAEASLAAAVQQIRARLQAPAWSSPYRSEWLPDLRAFTAPLYASLQQGAVLWLDYGYPERTFYHPERNQGTLTCFSQHQAHDHVLMHPGQQDLTAHVNFSQIVVDAEEQDLFAAGYSSQAGFLLSSGLLEHLRTPEERAQAQILLMPEAMGETMKVLCLSRNITWEPLLPAFNKSDVL